MVVQQLGELTECKANDKCLDKDARLCLSSQSGMEDEHAVSDV